MNVLVLVKEVAILSEQFGIVENGIDENDIEYALNEWDDYAIEEAVQLAESGIADEVVIATIGPERAEETVRRGLAKGADRAIRVWDGPLADVDLLGVSAKTKILASIIREEEPDLVFAGVQSGDDMFGGTGVAVAEAVDYAWAAVVNEVEVDDYAGVATVDRELEGGLIEHTEVQLPAVLTVQTGLNEPRYASLRGVRMAQRKEVDHRTLGDLDIDPGILESNVRLTRMRKPEVSDEATIFSGTAEESATKMADLLRDHWVDAV